MHGHAGKLLFGLLEPNKQAVVLMVGRVQLVFPMLSNLGIPSSNPLRSYYEGHSIQSITFPIQLMKRLGVETVVGKTVPDAITSH